ncbi:unnamed protein product [Mytilus coruscus]|uniref:Uncharacterized protein n=1 Tax=Mytilus coruscus TaxID=42192 RepID=A0A6J8C5Q0_MYTCO|nr:unnamed protein product [Mytilus coruscus]
MFLRKLQGTAAGTAAWLTNVGNKHGQILMSVVTAGEGAGLDAMLSGLENRYSDAGTSPPEWCSEDLEALKGAKEDQLATDGVPNGQPIDWITKKELSLHCRRTTRISEDITDLISETPESLLLGTPLLDANKVEEMWKVQQNHVPCILDPPGSQLYVQTGVLKKGGHMLLTYMCARGSISLESFHLHLNRFIPGGERNRGDGTYLTDVPSTLSSSTTLLRDSIPITEMMPETVPLEHTVSTTPTTSSGAPAVRATPNTSTNVLPLDPVADEQTDPSDGLQHVHNLADYLVQLDATRSLSRSQEEQAIALWDRLCPFDKRATIMQPKTKSNPRGRFMSSKTSKGPVKSNEEKTKSYKQRQKSEEELILSQGIEVSTPSFIAPATDPVPAALGRPVTLTSQPIAPHFTFILPPSTAGMSKVRVRCPKPPQNTAIPQSQSQIFQIQMTVQNRMPCPLNPRGATRYTTDTSDSPSTTSYFNHLR